MELLLSVCLGWQTHYKWIVSFTQNVIKLVIAFFYRFTVFSFTFHLPTSTSPLIYRITLYNYIIMKTTSKLAPKKGGGGFNSNFIKHDKCKTNHKQEGKNCLNLCFSNRFLSVISKSTVKKGEFTVHTTEISVSHSEQKQKHQRLKASF